MSKRKLFFQLAVILWLIFHFYGPVFAQTQKDLLDIRERLIRLEEGQKALNQRIDDLDKRLSKRIDDLDNKLSKRIDDLINLIYVVLAGMFALVGFVLWDRRSALAPAIRRTRDIEEREEKLERAIKEFALKNPEMKEILKSLGLL